MSKPNADVDFSHALEWLWLAQEKKKESENKLLIARRLAERAAEKLLEAKEDLRLAFFRDGGKAAQISFSPLTSRRAPMHLEVDSGAIVSTVTVLKWAMLANGEIEEVFRQEFKIDSESGRQLMALAGKTPLEIIHGLQAMKLLAPDKDKFVSYSGHYFAEVNGLDWVEIPLAE